jgi:hypothetical protein
MDSRQLTSAELIGWLRHMEDSRKNEKKKRKFRQCADRIDELEALYYELLYEVGIKHPGETRHQTALRYIQQHEQHDCAEKMAPQALK